MCYRRLLLGALLAAALLLAQSTKPVSKSGLIEALRIGGLSQAEFIQIVEKRGVDFQPSAQDERDLRAAGASSELIAAVRAHYRGAPKAAAPASTAPLTKNEIVTLLEVGTPSERVEQLVKQRGVAFVLTPEARQEIEAAGASPALMAALSGPPAKPAAAPSRTPAVRSVQSLQDVRKVYVEKMPNELDKHLRAEIARQMGARLVVVLNKADADAVLTGVAEERSGAGSTITGGLGITHTASGAVTLTDPAGQRILWASEAGDRSVPLFGRGGPKKVAERLVGALKRAYEGR